MAAIAPAFSAVRPEYIDQGFIHWTVTCQASTKSDDPTFLAIHKSIVSGRAYEVLRHGTEKVTQENEMGNAAKFLMAPGCEGLRECGCEVLGRSPTNKHRDYFENKVIEQITHFNKESQPTSIRITAFATGLLFGELVLLIKLINELSSLGIDKKIELNCVDYKYEVLEENFERNYATNHEALSWKKDVNDAVTGLTTAVNRIINLTTVHFSCPIVLRFFKSVDDYIQHAKTDAAYKYDFLVGADRGATDRSIEKLAEAGTNIATAVFLERLWKNDEDCAFLHTIDQKRISKFEPL